MKVVVTWRVSISLHLFISCLATKLYDAFVFLFSFAVRNTRRGIEY